ncbi:MAG: AI-2E family transporter [Lachnospiraceae bacterium]|nr:AI-2E family transporter [Lachnospiraceae bacterium]
MKFGNYFEEKKWLQYTIAACSAVLFFVVLTELNAILAQIGKFMTLVRPVVFGVVIAYLISPLVNFFNRTLYRGIKKEGVRQQLSNVTAMISVCILFILLMSGLIPQLIDSIKMFISNINAYAETLQDMLEFIVEKGESHNLDMSILDKSTTGLLNDLVSIITENTGKIAEGSLSATSSALNLGLGLILAVYFIVYKNTVISSYHRILHAILPEKKYKSTTSFLSECNMIMTTYVVSDILDGIIVAIINAIFMMITGMPYLVLISLVVGVTNLIPTFGPFIGAFIAGLILLCSSPQSVVLFLVFTLILQTIDGYVIKPKLFGGALGVSGVWITLGIIVGAKLFGITGVLLSVPVVAIIQFVLHGYIVRKEEEKTEALMMAADQAVIKGNESVKS